MIEGLRRFQRTFLNAVEDDRYDTVALSGPRSLGKTALAAHVLERCLTPGDVLHEPGKEYLLGAATLEQARMTYAFIREALEPTGEYRWIDSATRLGCTHLRTNTKLRALSSNAKASFGLVNVPLMVLDEPGALEIVGGQMLSDSLFTAQGKVGSRLKLVLIGTLAPMATSSGHWWFDLIERGTAGSVHVQNFQGDGESWDNWQTIRKANPLVALDAFSRKKLLEERDDARGDTRLKARFMSYRLNLPTGDESTVLLTVEDWQSVEGREVPEREGAPLVAVDLGAGRAFSAAVAMWTNGRTEAMALAPGIPGIEVQEKRDRVPGGTYQKLVNSGRLMVAEGLQVQPPKQLVDAMLSEWGKPRVIVCDRFQLKYLEDATSGIPIEVRVVQWSQATEDIRSTRKLAKDGPMACAVESRDIVRAALSVAKVQNDTSGNSRLIKRGNNNTGRDDVAAALTLVAGLVDRMPPARTKPLRLAVFE